jgi:pSer/pThr/pTyr-binding forkhead associated (FHA) protein
VGGRHITEYVDDLIDLGADGFRHKYRHAVLVRADSKDAGLDSEFRTAVATGETLDAIRRIAREVTSPSVAPPSSAPPGTLPVGSLAGEVIPIVKRGTAFREQIGVGRARNVDIHLPLPRISKYHGYFTRVDEETYTITDAASTNGICLNSERIPPKVATLVPDGSEISLGPYRFVFYGPRAFCATVARRAADR